MKANISQKQVFHSYKMEKLLFHNDEKLVFKKHRMIIERNNLKIKELKAN